MTATPAPTWSPGDLEAFESGAFSYWQHIEDGNSSAANRQLKATDRVIAKLRLSGGLERALEPLLSNSSPVIRHHAAAYLVNSGKRAQALAVLQALIIEDQTLVGISAAAVLRAHHLT